MALATRCPHCGTTFRVAQDQLKLRAGLVRCGSCQQIFNGIDALVGAPPADVAPPASLAAPADGADAAETPPANRADPAPAIPTPAPAALAEAPPASQPETPAAAAPAAGARMAEPFAVPEMPPSTEPEPTLALNFDIDFDTPAGEVGEVGEAGEERAEAATPAPLNAGQRLKARLGRTRRLPVPEPTALAPHDDAPVPDEPAAAPAGVAAYDNHFDAALDAALAAPPDTTRLEPEAGDFPTELLVGDEEPDFVVRTRRASAAQRRQRALMLAGVLLLALALLVQGVFFLRTRIAAAWPATRPALTRMCAPFGCKVGFPAQIDMLSLESQELQTLPNQSLVLSSLLRNRGSTVQSWPALELTLLDGADKPIARRVFNPADYAPSRAELAAGLAPRSESAVKVYFELGALQPASYRVYIFYP